MKKRTPGRPVGGIYAGQNFSIQQKSLIILREIAVAERRKISHIVDDAVSNYLEKFYPEYLC